MFKRAMRVLAHAKRPVLAGYDNGKPRSVTLALMQCGACSTELVTNHSLHAGCPVCASTMHPVDEIVVRDKSGEPVIDKRTGDVQVKTLDLTKEQLTDMPVVAKCGSCHTDFRGDDEIVANLKGHNIHCPVCASAITLSAEEEEYSEDEEIEEPSEDSGEGETEDDFFSGDESEEGDSEEPEDNSEDIDTLDEPIPDTVIPDPSDDEEKEDDSAGSAMTDEEFAAGLRTEASVKRKKLKVKKLKRVNAAAEENEENENNEDGDDQDVMDNEPAPAPDAPAAETTARFQVNAFDLARSKKNIAFNFVMAGDKNVVWYLFANHRPVAVAKKENVAQAMHGIFATSAFGRAFAAAAGDGVTDEVVNDFGLEPVIIEQPVSEVVEQQVNQQVEEKTAELSKIIADTKAQFEQCAGIAAVGINKGFFGKANPLRQPFIDALASINVRSPERLVDRVLAENGEEYLRTIIAKAMELQTKSPETLNEIASLVEASVYKVEASTPVNRADEVSENLTRGNFPISISGFEAVASTKPETDPHNNVRQIFGGLGRRRV